MEEILEEIQLSQLQENIQRTLENVMRSRQPVLVSDHGVILVKIVPLAPSDQTSWLGSMRGTGEITGDIIAPAEDTDAWDVLNDLTLITEDDKLKSSNQIKILSSVD